MQIKHARARIAHWQSLLLWCRQNQLLEQDSITMHEQQQRMQQEAADLAQRLEVVLHDKFSHRHGGFDSDTPIDKALNFLQGCISVSSCLSSML